MYFDERSGINHDSLRKMVQPILDQKNATLLEDIHIVHSNYHTIGLCYAVIVAYLMSRINIIKVDSELFEDLSSEQSQKNMD